VIQCLHCRRYFEPPHAASAFCSADCRTAFTKPGAAEPPPKVATPAPKPRREPRWEQLPDDAAAEQLRVVLVSLGWPEAVSVAEVRAKAEALALPLAARLSSGNALPSWFADNGYERLPPPATARRIARTGESIIRNWTWGFGGRFHVVYVRTGLEDAAAVATIRAKQKEALVARRSQRAAKRYGQGADL
jgi:hypothetical protein